MPQDDGFFALRHNTDELPGWGVRVARTAWARAAGLLFRKPLAANEGLWITACNSVHMVGMRYAIDVIFVDADGRVTKLVPDLRPFQAALSWKAKAALELPSGALLRLPLQVGDHLSLVAR